MAKDTKILLIVAVLAIELAGLFALKQNSAEKSLPVFSCDLGEKTVTVTTEGSQLIFNYGNILIRGNVDSGNVAYHHEMWAHAEDKQLRFRQGDNSYVIFNRWASPSYEGKGATDYSGLLIFKGYDKIDLKFCNDSGEFLSNFDLSTLPDDAEHVIPEQEIAVSVEDVLDNLDSDEMMPGAYRDEHNCIPSAGYEWSEKKQECVRPWLEEENTRQTDDEQITETGLITAVEDGAYPMYSVTMEFPKAHFTQTFSLNVETPSVDTSALEKAVGQYVTFNYTSALENDLLEMELNGKPILDGWKEASLKKVTGILSGADKVTESDLPGLVTVTDQAGTQFHFDYYVPPEMLAANGKEVTAYYAINPKNKIVSINLP